MGQEGWGFGKSFISELLFIPKNDCFVLVKMTLEYPVISPYKMVRFFKKKWGLEQAFPPISHPHPHLFTSIFTRKCFLHFQSFVKRLLCRLFGCKLLVLGNMASSLLDIPLSPSSESELVFIPPLHEMFFPPLCKSNPLLLLLRKEQCFFF